MRDIVGVTGMKLLRAIVGGESDERVLSGFHSKRMKASKEDWERALRGNYKEAHIFCLGQALAKYDFCMVQMEECDALIERKLMLLADGEEARLDEEVEGRPRQTRKNGQNDYNFDAKGYLTSIYGVDITKIDGIGEKLALDILAAVGTDLSKWPSASHFTSWLRLAPMVKISGGKTIGHFRESTKNGATEAFKNAAFALANNKGPMGEFYRKLRYRKGPVIANKATARKFAVIFYKMVTNGEEYNPNLMKDKLDQQRKKKEQKLIKQAETLGFKVVRAA